MLFLLIFWMSSKFLSMSHLLRPAALRIRPGSWIAATGEIVPSGLNQIYTALQHPAREILQCNNFREKRLARA
jgi:hypothetical protein